MNSILITLQENTFIFKGKKKEMLIMRPHKLKSKRTSFFQTEKCYSYISPLLLKQDRERKDWILHDIVLAM